MTQKLLTVMGPKAGKRLHAELGLSQADLQKIYRTMVAVRVLDTKCINLQRQGRIGFYVPALGQEACHVGAAFALEPTDWIFPHYRDTGTPILRGTTIQDMVNQLFGNREDLSKGRQMPNHFSFREQNFVSISSPLATQIVQAAGAAYAAKVRKDGHVVMTTFGDGCTSENDFHAGMNFAGVQKLPCVFLCENNQWAISVPIQLQTASDGLAVKAVAYGFEGIAVDGNDVLAVYKAAKEAVDKARSGGGPTLLEAVTYRMGPHSTSDDPSRYCPPAELEEWKRKDPIERFKRYLVENRILTQKEDEAMRRELEEEVTAAIAHAETVAAPPPETLFDDVYESIIPNLEEQRQQLLDELRDQED